MSVVAASSADGENFRGSVGSTLWVDDLSFSWSTIRSFMNQATPIAIIVSGTTATIPNAERVRSVQAVDLTGRSLSLGQVNRRQGGSLSMQRRNVVSSQHEISTAFLEARSLGFYIH
ncbi:MAG: PCMD domain-containing protein [Ignavibacteria bacterium]|nr:PCMD domain-containing protein [Ignavibacteria bacterium]